MHSESCHYTYLLNYLHTHLLTYILTYPLTYLLTHLLTYSPTYLLIYLLTYLLAHLITYLPTYLFTYLPTYLPTYLLTCLPIYLPTYLHTHLFTYFLTYLLTYLLTPWCRVLLEKLTGLQLVKKFPTFHGTRRFITALNKRPPPVFILGQPNPAHIPTSHLLEIHLNIIHPSTPRSPQWSLSLRFPHQDPINPPLLAHTRHMPSPSHSSRFYHPHNIG